MRFRDPAGRVVHLAYGTNVHPAEDLHGVVDQLRRFAEPVRQTLGVPLLGVGLWLAAPVAAQLARDPSAVAGLRSSLQEHGLEVVTCNAFPYTGFHAPVVKHAVYRPDWTQPERADYTLQVAQVLAGLLPDDVTGGSISTLPLGWRVGWDERMTHGAIAALRRVAGSLGRLRERTGKAIRLAVEPEPGCAVETVAQAAAALGELGEHIGVCIDTCHLAVQFEAAVAAVRDLADAGVPLVKVQVSSALRSPRPSDPVERAGLRAFAEPKFLHQTRTRDRSGAVLGVDDLPAALEGELPSDEEWRVHFHVPVHTTDRDTTQAELVGALPALLGVDGIPPHLEVETYTWGVLPLGRRPLDDAGLVAGIAREVDWTRVQLRALGLQESTA